MTTIVHMPVLDKKRDVINYLEEDFKPLCYMAADLAIAEVPLPGVFFDDLATIADTLARVLRGERPAGGVSTESMEYLGVLAAAYDAMRKKLAESDCREPGAFRTRDGLLAQAHPSTMATLAGLVSEAARVADAEWAVTRNRERLRRDLESKARKLSRWPWPGGEGESSEQADAR